MTGPEPKWRQYERWVAELIKARAPDANVVHDVRVLGRAGFLRQIDVLVTGSFPGLLPRQRMVVEARYRRRPLGPSDVAALRSLMHDVGAPLGLLVTPTGFTAGAKASASMYPGIQLEV